jgi:hypothetical protein
VNYDRVIGSTSGLIFMSTPHRGSKFATMLVKVLQPFCLIVPPTRYIGELIHNSTRLEDINIRFRKLANFQIYSLYETVSMIWPVKEVLSTSNSTRRQAKVAQMVSSETSSILGYPTETPVAVKANHREICRFPDREHPRYLQLRGFLNKIVSDANKRASQAGNALDINQTGFQPPDSII